MILPPSRSLGSSTIPQIPILPTGFASSSEPPLICLAQRDDLDDILFSIPMPADPQPPSAPSPQLLVIDLSEDSSETETPPEDSCPERRFQFGAEIGREELAILGKKTGWFNDNIVDSFLQEVDHLHSSPKVLVLSVYFWEVLNQPGGIIRSAKYSHGLHSPSVKIVLIPVHHHDNHWILVVADLIESKLFVFDSMMAAKKTHYARVLATLRSWFQSVKPGARSPRAVYVKTPQQPDGHSCGSYCCAFAEYVITSYETTGNAFHIDPQSKPFAKTVAGMRRRITNLKHTRNIRQRTQ